MLCAAFFSGCGVAPASGSGSSSSSPSDTPVAALSTSKLVFPNQTVGTTSAPKTITLTNSGSQELSIANISVSGDFAQTNSCGSTLAAGASCLVSVTFTPKSAGTRNGSIAFSDNAAASPQSVTLTGTGVAASAVVSLSPGSLNFGSQTVGTTSSSQAVTLSNTGNATLSISGITVSGDFGQANNCGSSLGAGNSCSIYVTFAPTSSGTRTGTLSVSDDAAGSPQTVSLSGTGAAAGSLTASPATLSFGTVTVGQSKSLNVTIKNTGSSNVTISSVSPSGGDLSVSGIATPLTLSSQQSTTFTVTFAPTSSGTISATINVANSSSTPNLAIPVSGTGAASTSHSVSLQWDPSTNAVGYYVLRGVTSGGPYAPLFSSPISATIYSDMSVAAGSTYYYVVTAVGTDSSQSAYSSEVSATIPTP
jgi:hypothetical protein